MQHPDDKNPYRKWNLIIGVSIIITGGLQIYNKDSIAFDFQTVYIILYLAFGIYLIYKNFKEPNAN